jgi:hypothetical protein
MRLITLLAVVLLIILVPTASALAHSPVFPDDNHSPSTAYNIRNPDKSCAIYTALENDGDVDYYRFIREKGEKIQISLILSASPSETGFLPSFALLGPGLTPDNQLTDRIEVPSGYGAFIVDGEDPGKAAYEPFTPGWFYEVGNLTLTAHDDGTYYIAVFDTNHHDEHIHEHQPGNYALIVGYLEAFTPLELIMIPFSVQEIYVWEGQNQFIIFLPMILVLVLGSTLVYRRYRQGKNPKGLSKWLAGIGGIAFLGSTLGTIYQMSLALNTTGLTVEAVLTLIIALISIILGVFTLRYALRSEPALTAPRRIGLITTGVLALFLWSGFYLGPALVIAAALVPRHTME